MTTLKIADIRRDGATQPRSGMNQEMVEQYAADLRRGDVFPPVVVFWDGAFHWAADGFHRLAAAEKEGRSEIEADVHAGTQQDAQWYSFSVNRAHGLRRTRADVDRQVRGALLHPLGSGLSDRQVAEHVGVDHKTVARVRSQLESTGEIPQSDQRTGRDGRSINTVRIGHTQPELPGRAVVIEGWPEKPEAPLTGQEGAESNGLPRKTMEDPPAAPAAAELERGIRRWLTQHATEDHTWRKILEAIECSAPDGLRWLRAIETSQLLPAGVRSADDLRPACANILAQMRAVSRGDVAYLERTRAQAGPVTAWAAPKAPPAEVPTPCASVGEVAIYHQDARRLSAFVPAGSVHLVVTSPPYNVGMPYASHDDSLPEAQYQALIANVLDQCHAVLVDGGRVAVNVPFGVGRNPWRPLAAKVMTMVERAGFTLRGQIIWDKHSCQNSTAWGSWRSPTNPCLRDTAECVVVAQKGGGMLSVPDGVLCHDEKGSYSPWLADPDLFTMLAQDHWEIAPESAQSIGHPAPFPVALPERLMRLYGYPGCTVLDPFAGSGTVGVAALRLGCRAILIDTAESYCEIARRRCLEETAQPLISAT